MSIRTDLALESINAAKISEGITKTERGKAFKITEINIAEDKHGEKIARKKENILLLKAVYSVVFQKISVKCARNFQKSFHSLFPTVKYSLWGWATMI